MVGVIPEAVAWHDAECASYSADLDLWRELAAAAAGPLLDIGCGTGRVALDLASRGHEVTALDVDRGLVDELARRARQRGLRIDCVLEDARSLELGRRFALALAPMQVVQLLGGHQGRAKLLARVRDHLEPGALFAAAVADPFEGVAPEDALPPLPDLREEEGWVYSSTPVAVRAEDGAVAVDRLRQAVSPEGELSEAVATVRLEALTVAQLEEEGGRAGFAPRPPRRVPETRDHVGSTVVLLEAP
jgi:SAM-dependent methyltransferase